MALSRVISSRAKSSDAFRTIGEVSEDLDVPKHVLRFWEGKFPQLKPMKRGGGRRFYRPEDVALLRGIHQLLHASGYTIKGVQRILREQGVDVVKAANPGAGAQGSAQGSVQGSIALSTDGGIPAVAPAPSAKSRSGKKGDIKRAPIPAPLRAELEALASELDAVLALARGESARAIAEARVGGGKPRRG